MRPTNNSIREAFASEVTRGGISNPHPFCPMTRSLRRAPRPTSIGTPLHSRRWRTPRRQWPRHWATMLLVLSSLVLVGLVHISWQRSAAHNRAQLERQQHELLQRAQQAADRSDWSAAITAIDQTLQLETQRPESSSSASRIEELQLERSAYFADAVADYLDQTRDPASDSASLLLRGRNMLESAREEPDWRIHCSAIRQALQSIQRRWVANRLQRAEDALAYGHDEAGLVEIGVIFGPGDLPEVPIDPDQIAEASRLAEAIAARRGLQIETPTGSFWLGTADRYLKALASTLRIVGYEKPWLPAPNHPDLVAIWERSARFRIAIQLDEQRGRYYLNTRSRTADLLARITVFDGLSRVSQRLVSSRTEVPLPPNYRPPLAFEGGDQAKPSPELEAQLYRNAFDRLIVRMTGAFGSIVRPIVVTEPPSDRPDAPPFSSMLAHPSQSRVRSQDVDVGRSVTQGPQRPRPKKFR